MLDYDCQGRGPTGCTEDPPLAPPNQAPVPPKLSEAPPPACRMPYRRLTSGRLLSLAAPKMASIVEGPLSKWTNVMKGWQYRWFVLDYNAGLLSYYTVSGCGRAAGTAGYGEPGRGCSAVGTAVREVPLWRRALRAGSQ